MLKLGNRELEIPIIQGGMGVGVSLGNLAGTVAGCGAMGVISTVNAGYREDDFEKNPIQANVRALRQEIKKALDIAKGKGIVAINAMVAVNRYEESVKAAIDAGVQAVISGAGLPLALPKLTKGTECMAAPIVSSGKAASVICKNWDRKYGVAPDFVVIEGPEAGGHLGFSREQIENHTAKSIYDIFPEVKEAIEPYEEKYDREIPVFLAGGIFDGADMAKATDAGASGVQMATRFIATTECDASEEYKRVIVDASEDDVTIIKSPVGMPGRALLTPLIQKLQQGEKFAPKICNDCLKSCPHGTKTPYCISRALIEAVKGNVREGLFFCGSNVGKIKKIVSVRELIDEIVSEWRKSS